ncbi:MAG: antibiotic biosynthesis monooxygenase [Pseudomonadota bacterium]
MPAYVYVVMRARPGMEAQLEAAMREAVGRGLAEPGALRYELLRDAADPRALAFFGKWETREQHRHHVAQPYVAAFHERIADWVEHKEIRLFDAAPDAEGGPTGR